jgi:PAS domain S-box-containing protein
MDRRKILIVEDEGITAAYLQKTLTSLGYQALDPCASGEAALEQAQALLPDLVLMDIRLEGSMDGIECAGQIHKKLGIPVIMLTANDDAEIMDLSKDSVPYGYIIKPFQDKNLRASIEIALNLHDMENRLRDSEARYRSVVEQTSESIFLIDPQSLNVLGANAAFCRLLGYQPEEMSLLRLFDVVAEEPDAIDLHIKQILEMGVLNLLESNYRRKDREIVPVEVNANLIHFQSQQVISMLVRDISERKRMDRELWQSNQQLEAQVRSRTLDLTKTNLALREEVVQRQQAEIRLTELAQTLEQRVKDRTGELLALYHIMVITRESQSIEEILSLSLAHVLESLDSGTLGGALFLLSENGEGIERKIGLNLSDYEVSCLEQRLLEDRASLGSSLKEQTVNKMVITIKSCLGEGRNVLIIPLEVSGHTLGLLALLSNNQPLSSDEMKLAQSLADHIATAVLNVRLNQRSGGRAICIGAISE